MPTSPTRNLPNHSINPLYAARIAQTAHQQSSSRQNEPVYARLPIAPRTASPVPHLTSLYHFSRAGEYGDRSYPGNCGGKLIRDLLLFFRSQNVFDPMTGSGTCADVCRKLRIPCLSRDIRQGFDATDADCFRSLPAGSTFDFVWAHPPYWRQKLYTSDSRDLSRTSTLAAFLERYGAFIANCTSVLSSGGKFAILMGDYCDRQAGFVPLTHHTKRLAFDAGLRQHCTDIIRFSHGASSSRKICRSSFIPGLHDVCMVFEKAQ
jgi:hypothetical protein